MIYRVRKDGDYNVVLMGGYLDYESIKGVVDCIAEIYTENPHAKVIIDMNHLEFVGSSGITVLVKEVNTFNSKKFKPLYCGMKNEFIRLFRMFEGQESFLIFNTIEDSKSYSEQMYRMPHTPPVTLVD